MSELQRSSSFYRRIGLAGIAADERAIVHQVYRVLHWLMMLVTLVAAVAFYLDEVAKDPAVQGMARAIDMVVLVSYLLELLVLLLLVRNKLRYLRENWLNSVLLITLTLGATADADDWLVLLRLLRLTTIGLLIARLSLGLRSLTPSSAPFLLLLFAGLMGASGLVFSWIEPTVHNFGQGLWLAFTSAATVGYGDLVPTTTASKLFSAILVVTGVSLLSMATASLAAFFIGKEEQRLRHELHRDVKLLVARLERMELRQQQNLQRLKSRLAADPASSQAQHQAPAVHKAGRKRRRRRLANGHRAGLDEARKPGS